MGINAVNDLGAPVLVTAVDLTIETVAPDYSKYATGIMAVGGYLGAYFNYGGDFVKNVGIASLPAFAKNIYDWARAGTTAGRARGATRPMKFQRSTVSRYPATHTEAPFPGVKLV